MTGLYHGSRWEDDLAAAIGNTPLIKLRRASEATGCTILGKAEFMNPGGSVKDRAGLFIIADAEKRGALKPGGTVVEGTAGNTGIGLTLVGNARGYRCVIVMPETQSKEKIDFLRMIGADLRLVPAKPYRDPGNYVHVSRRMAEEMGAVWANQFDNLANREGHRATTGVEIWEQTEGKVDAFTCACGTGGTLAGVAFALKAKNPDVRIVLADPEGSGLYGWVKSNDLTMYRQLDHRGHRQLARHRQPGRRADRRRGTHSGRRGAGVHLRPADPRGAVGGNVVGDQHRGGDTGGEGAGARAHGGDDPGRRRFALSVEAVQPGVPAVEEPAGAGVDGLRAFAGVAATRFGCRQTVPCSCGVPLPCRTCHAQETGCARRCRVGHDFEVGRVMGRPMCIDQKEDAMRPAKEWPARRFDRARSADIPNKLQKIVADIEECGHANLTRLTVHQEVV